MATLLRPLPARSRTGDAPPTLPAGVGFGLWAALVVVGLVWGAAAAGRDVGLGAAPLVGRWDLRLPQGLLIAAVVAGAVILAGPRLALRLPSPALPIVAGATAVAWAVALAASDGWARLTAPLTSRFEYEPYASTVGSAPDFLRGFVDAVPDLPIHVKAHPPGATLVPWGLDRLGLAGAGWFAAVVILGWGVAVAAAVHAVRSVSGEAAARRAAPALALLPAVVWVATSADALFAGVLAPGVALAVSGRRRAAVAGGMVLGCGLLLTYGGALVLLVPVAVAWRRRRPADVAALLAGVVTVLLVAGAAGFWWPDGLAATRLEYWDGVASRRPAAYLTLAGNPAALALAAGPAVLAGLLRRPGTLSVAALAAVLVADLSQLSRGEVERIWLPFVPWLAAAAPGLDRRWLAAQAVVGLGLQAALRSTW